MQEGWTVIASRRAAEWAALPEPAARTGWLDHQQHLDDTLVRAMKSAADEALDQEPQRGLELASGIIEAAERTRSPLHRAWGEMARANALLYMSRYAEAVVHYDEAEALCSRAGEVTEGARAQIGKVYALMSTGAYDAGLAVAEQCYATLAARGAWLFAARAAMNAANILQRQGKIDEALAAFDRAEDACGRAGEVATRDRLALMLNRALLQIVANRYRPAREALMHVYREALRAGYPVRAARAAVALANINATLGRYNDALMLFDQAREVFAEEAMIHDVLVTQTDALDCSLALNLHDRILEETAELIPQLEEANAPCELAQASYARGLALLARRRFLDAR